MDVELVVWELANPPAKENVMGAQDVVVDALIHVIIPVPDVVVDVLDAGALVKQAAVVDALVDVLDVAVAVDVDRVAEDVVGVEVVVDVADVTVHALMGLEHKEVYLNGKLWF